MSGGLLSIIGLTSITTVDRGIKFYISFTWCNKYFVCNIGLCLRLQKSIVTLRRFTILFALKASVSYIINCVTISYVVNVRIPNLLRL